jgi:hypothetical protein
VEPRPGPYRGTDRDYGSGWLRKWRPIVFPEHALLIVEERLKEQEAEGVEMPEGIERTSWRCGC